MVFAKKNSSDTAYSESLGVAASIVCKSRVFAFHCFTTCHAAVWGADRYICRNKSSVSYIGQNDIGEKIFTSAVKGQILCKLSTNPAQIRKKERFIGFIPDVAVEKEYFTVYINKTQR